MVKKKVFEKKKQRKFKFFFHQKDFREKTLVEKKIVVRGKQTEGRVKRVLYLDFESMLKVV